MEFLGLLIATCRLIIIIIYIYIYLFIDHLTTSTGSGASLFVPQAAHPRAVLGVGSLGSLGAVIDPVTHVHWKSYTTMDGCSGCCATTTARTGLLRERVQGKGIHIHVQANTPNDAEPSEQES